MSRQSQAQRAGWAAFFGTAVEWYDFFIFGTASALVLGDLFFPTVDPAAGTLLAFATFGAGYLARPLGGIVFGHLGDRVGRKKSLIITLLMMGVVTVAIGALPTYATIGIAAPVILVVLRLIQGIAVGGEWGGAVLIASEHAGKRSRVAAGAWAQQGAPAGNLLASLAFLLVSGLPDDQFTSWGWRLPFLFSAVLIVIGLVIRSRIEEPPEVLAAIRANHSTRLPLVEVLRTAPTIVLVALCVGAVSASFGTFFKVLGLDFATGEVGIDRQGFLLALTLMSLFQLLFQPFAALAAVRFEPIRVLVVALVASIPLIPVSWLLIQTGSVTLSTIGMIVSLAPICWLFGLLGGFLAEAFPTRIRYTAISLAYQINTLVFVAPLPLVGGALLDASGSVWSVIGLQLAFAVVSLLSTLWIARRTGAGHRAPDTSVDAADPTTPAAVADGPER
ncbi:MFS transporter [Pseudonocardia halophobica]|uniref:Putative proline/betaine transporter n=1 Tax=Pseudonocardia halophobica TaxID=29401 RepID=A0A9W6NVH8_9PSEU|nr:MFS transporter [Pseudonocardia halophobica]GLL10633.1 MFS transporter [Pseudonocardia halophobica]